jgi:hypothetical protein
MAREAPTVKPVCRAAIGGLFAIWLAPLQAEPVRCGETCRCAETRPAAAVEPAKETPAKA